MNPIYSLQHRIWRIENNALRRLAAVVSTAVVVLPAWALFWLVATPALAAGMIILKGLFGAIEAAECLYFSIRAEPAGWAHKIRVFRTLWRSSRSVFEANRPVAVFRGRRR